MKQFITAVLLLLISFVAFAEGPFLQEGFASYYADKFEGRKTASGDIYSHNELTCAHRTLAFGTMVRITNVKNNKSIVCRVNDRGPFVKNRIIDLSRNAASQLDFVVDGLAKVKIEVLPHVEVDIVEVPTDSIPSNVFAAKQTIVDYELYDIIVSKSTIKGYTVQIASYKEMANLLRIVDDIKSVIEHDIRIQVVNIDGEKTYRVQTGNFDTREDAESEGNKLKLLYPDCFVVQL
jgi:rare lipoprotein A